MEYTFFDFLTLIGSLGLFLYGMKVMSEGLQKVAGDRLRGILTAMTTNRVTGVLTGVLITALIQSSSATTVMVVSFVNAGLLSLTQSVSVIMGANVGTTVTAWIISIFGFKVNISLFAIPLIGLAIPFIFLGIAGGDLGASLSSVLLFCLWGLNSSKIQFLTFRIILKYFRFLPNTPIWGICRYCSFF